MNKMRHNLILLFLAFLALYPQSGFAAPAGGNSGVLALLEHSDMSAARGMSLVESMIAQINNWQDYCCHSELQCYKGKGTHKSECRFYVKGGKVRVEVTGGGYRDGTVLVRKEGRVRARGGGMLGGITMNLDPSSRMLILPNGINVMWSDFPTVLADLKKELLSGSTCQASGTVNEGGENLLVLDVFAGKTPGSLITKRIFIDAARKIPVRWDLFSQGKLLSSAFFKNLKPNNGLAEQMFSL